MKLDKGFKSISFHEEKVEKKKNQIMMVIRNVLSSKVVVIMVVWMVLGVEVRLVMRLNV